MRTILSFLLLISLKTFSKMFYTLEFKWISKINDFERIRLIVFLNHTSLYEPLFMQVAPNWFLWRLARKMIAPAADITLKRPLVGFLWKSMGRFISISRKRDKSWFKFMKLIENRNIVVIAPEGRMKRKTGLDKNGRAMTVRSGVADIIEVIPEGRIMIAYSGGLHHVQHPGDALPTLFQKIKLNLEVLEISDYRAQFSSEGIPLKRDIIADLESRLKQNCPS